MRSVTGLVLTAGGLVGLAYVAKAFLPSAPVLTIQWNAQAFFIPFNIAAFWVCLTTGIFASACQMIRAMLGDVERLR